MNDKDFSHIGIDHFDRLILNVLQENNQLSHAEIGERVGLSTSAVRRRIKLLRHSGVITKDVALIAPEGLGIQLIVTVQFGDETIQAYDKFDQQIKRQPEILQAYHVAGSSDYVLIVHAPSLPWYETWSKEKFMSNPHIKRYSTQVVWSCKKFSTKIAL